MATLVSKDRIKKHFASVARPYATKQNFIWRLLRHWEKTNFTEISKNLAKDNCLELGGADGEYSKILLANGAKKVTCVDFNPSFAKNSSKIKFIYRDVEQYTTCEKYDLVICMGILEFLEHPQELLLKIRSFLSYSGKMIILLPTDSLRGSVYSFYYLLRGIKIGRLNLKNLTHQLEKHFLLERAVKGIFSGIGVYSKK